MTTNLRPESLDGWVAKVKTPDGSMFVTINEQNDAPIEMHINIGKCGSAMMAWAEALARVCSLALRQGTDIHGLLAEIGNVTSDRMIRIANGAIIHSGPEGVSYALQMYARMKFRELTDEIGLDDLRNGEVEQ